MVIRTFTRGNRPAAIGAGFFVVMGVLMTGALLFSWYWKNGQHAEAPAPVKPPGASDHMVLAAVAVRPGEPEAPVSKPEQTTPPDGGSGPTPAVWSPPRTPEKRTTLAPPPVSRPSYKPPSGASVANVSFRPPDDHNKKAGCAT